MEGHRGHTTCGSPTPLLYPPQVPANAHTIITEPTPDMVAKQQQQQQNLASPSKAAAAASHHHHPTLANHHHLAQPLNTTGINLGGSDTTPASTLAALQQQQQQQQQQLGGLTFSTLGGARLGVGPATTLALQQTGIGGGNQPAGLMLQQPLQQLPLGLASNLPLQLQQQVGFQPLQQLQQFQQFQQLQPAPALQLAGLSQQQVLQAIDQQNMGAAAVGGNTLSTTQPVMVLAQPLGATGAATGVVNGEQPVAAAVPPVATPAPVDGALVVKAEAPVDSAPSVLPDEGGAVAAAVVPPPAVMANGGGDTQAHTTATAGALRAAAHPQPHPSSLLQHLQQQQQQQQTGAGSCEQGVHHDHTHHAEHGQQLQAGGASAPSHIAAMLLGSLGGGADGASGHDHTMGGGHGHAGVHGPSATPPATIVVPGGGSPQVLGRAPGLPAPAALPVLTSRTAGEAAVAAGVTASGPKQHASGAPTGHTADSNHVQCPPGSKCDHDEARPMLGASSSLGSD